MLQKSGISLTSWGKGSWNPEYLQGFMNLENSRLLFISINFTTKTSHIPMVSGNECWYDHFMYLFGRKPNRKIEGFLNFGRNDGKQILFSCMFNQQNFRSAVRQVAFVHRMP